MSYIVFESSFPSTGIWRGDVTEGFLRYRFGGLIHEGPYFRNFTVSFYDFEVISIHLLSLTSFRKVTKINSFVINERDWLPWVEQYDSTVPFSLLNGNVYNRIYHFYIYLSSVFVG